MSKLNFNIPFKGLDGKEAKEEEASLGKSLANLLVSEGSTEKSTVLKFGEWAQKLWRGDVLDLDKADTELLEKTILESQRFTVMLKFQLLEIIEKSSKSK